MNKFSIQLGCVVPLILAFCLPGVAFAGSAQANLNCVSKAKPGFSIQGYIPGDSPEFDLNVKYGNSSTRFYRVIDFASPTQQSANSDITVVQALKDKVWTVASFSLRGQPYLYLQMYALPKTLKYAKIRNGYRAKFTSSVEFLAAEGEFPAQDVTTNVNCVLEYEI